MVRAMVLVSSLATVATAVPSEAPYWAQEESLSHSEITWSFDTLEHGAVPKAYSAKERNRRRTQTGPPPVHFDKRPILWNEKMFFLLNNYHDGMPHSCVLRPSTLHLHVHSIQSSPISVHKHWRFSYHVRASHVCWWAAAAVWLRQIQHPRRVLP